MIYRTFIPIALLAALGGCANNNPAVMDRPPSDSVGESARIQDKPFTAETRFAAGQVAESRGEFDAAVLQYREALRLQSKHVRSLYNLGCLYAQMKRYPDSIAVWRRYLAATDDSATGFSNLAFTLELAGNPSGAEANYKLGIAKDPINESCRINYGLMLARHGRIGEAVIQLQVVLTPAEAHFNIASVYEFQHRPEMAKLEYHEALALDPNFIDAREKLSSLGDFADGD